MFFLKQKTAYEMRISDWSSDVCSSDLFEEDPGGMDLRAQRSCPGGALSRRQFVAATAVGIAAFATTTLLPGFALAAQTAATAALPSTRSLAFRSLHTGEEVQATYLRDGRVQAEGVQRLNHVLRDWRSGEVWQMDRQPFDLLYALRRRMDRQQPSELISGYPSPATTPSPPPNTDGVATTPPQLPG